MSRFRNIIYSLLPVGALLSSSVLACMTDQAANSTQRAAGIANIYVDGTKTNGDVSTCGSQTSPCKTPGYALSLPAVGPGTVVHLLPTTVYTGSIYIRTLQGAYGKPIVIIGDGPASNRTKIQVSNIGNGIMLDGLRNDTGSADFALDHAACVAYITIKNLDVQAIGAVDGSPANGIFIKNAHHVQILDSAIHGSSGGGIATYLSDWISIERNTVFGNSLNTTGRVFTSGISTYQNKNHTSVDPESTNKINIVGNTVYYNINGAPANGCTYNGAPCTNSDGNGIIVDDGRHTQSPGNVLPAYVGFTNIYNNIAYGNGGRGIYSYQSENVAMFSNTAFYNMHDPYNGAPNQGEIMALDSANVKIWSNITYSDGLGGGSASLPTNGKIHYPISVVNRDFTGSANYIDYNSEWNAPNDTRLSVYLAPSVGGPTQVGLHNTFGDPKFKNIVNTPYDVRVEAGSPALGFTGLANYMFAGVDILFAPRPSITKTGTPPSVTAGAYEQPAP